MENELNVNLSTQYRAPLYLDSRHMLKLPNEITFNSLVHIYSAIVTTGSFYANLEIYDQQ